MQMRNQWIHTNRHFKIGAHIRESESAQLNALRQQQDKTSLTSATTTRSNTSNDSSSISLSSVSNDVVSRRLASVHNAAWKHSAVTSRDWHERPVVDRAWSASSVLAEYDAVAPSSAPAGDLRSDDLARLDPRRRRRPSLAAQSVQIGAFGSHHAIRRACCHQSRAASGGAVAGNAQRRCCCCALAGVWHACRLCSADCLALGSRAAARCRLSRLAGGRLISSVWLASFVSRALPVRSSSCTISTSRVVSNAVVCLPPRSPRVAQCTSLPICSSCICASCPSHSCRRHSIPIFMLIYETTASNEAALAHALRGALGAIRQHGCGSLLAALCIFFRDHVAVHAAESSMTSANLAIMIAPSVLRADSVREKRRTRSQSHHSGTRHVHDREE
jgi:hypothetical protein